MSLALPVDLVEPVVGGLLGGIDVDGGPTDEQLKVLGAIITHVWQRADLDLSAVTRLDAQSIADLLVTDDHRTVFHELHVTLETCRHPQAAAQVAAVQEYADALGVDGDDLEMFRDLVSQGVDRAKDDFGRFLTADLADRAEPALADTPVSPEQPERVLAERLGHFAEYAPGTLGQAFLTFYRQFGLTLPGVEASTMNHFFVAHDMTHTIAGISTTIPGEVALSAFQFAMNNSRVNRAALLASLVTHEAGFAHSGHLAHADTGVLATDSAALLLGQELQRGGLCTADFSLVDHFELAPLSLARVRAEFGVRPPVNPNDGHHFLW